MMMTKEMYAEKRKRDEQINKARITENGEREFLKYRSNGGAMNKQEYFEARLQGFKPKTANSGASWGLIIGATIGLSLIISPIGGLIVGAVMTAIKLSK
jgi:hypothetical protein